VGDWVVTIFAHGKLTTVASQKVISAYSRIYKNITCKLIAYSTEINSARPTSLCLPLPLPFSQLSRLRFVTSVQRETVCTCCSDSDRSGCWRWSTLHHYLCGRRRRTYLQVQENRSQVVLYLQFFFGF